MDITITCFNVDENKSVFDGVEALVTEIAKHQPNCEDCKRCDKCEKVTENSKRVNGDTVTNDCDEERLRFKPHSTLVASCSQALSYVHRGLDVLTKRVHLNENEDVLALKARFKSLFDGFNRITKGETHEVELTKDECDLIWNCLECLRGSFIADDPIHLLRDTNAISSAVREFKEFYTPEE